MNADEAVLMSPKQIQKMLGISRTKFFVDVKPKLGAPISLGARSPRWRLSEVQRFIEDTKTANPNAPWMK